MILGLYFLAFLVAKQIRLIAETTLCLSATLVSPTHSGHNFHDRRPSTLQFMHLTCHRMCFYKYIYHIYIITHDLQGV